MNRGARRSVVYFLRSKDEFLIKVGTTTNLQQRMSDLRRAGHSFDLLGYVPGGCALETMWRRRYKDRRYRDTKDWFFSCAELEQDVRDALGGVDVFCYERRRRD